MKYKLTFVATFETDKAIPLMNISGPGPAVMEQLENMDNPLQHLNDSEDETSAVSFVIEQES